MIKILNFQCRKIFCLFSRNILLPSFLFPALTFGDTAAPLPNEILKTMKKASLNAKKTAKHMQDQWGNLKKNEKVQNLYTHHQHYAHKTVDAMHTLVDKFGFLVSLGTAYAATHYLTSRKKIKKLQSENAQKSQEIEKNVKLLEAQEEKLNKNIAAHAALIQQKENELRETQDQYIQQLAAKDAETERIKRMHDALSSELESEKKEKKLLENNKEENRIQIEALNQKITENEKLLLQNQAELKNLEESQKTTLETAAQNIQETQAKVAALTEEKNGLNQLLQIKIFNENMAIGHIVTPPASGASPKPEPENTLRRAESIETQPASFLNVIPPSEESQKKMLAQKEKILIQQAENQKLFKNDNEELSSDSTPPVEVSSQAQIQNELQKQVKIRRNTKALQKAPFSRLFKPQNFSAFAYSFPQNSGPSPILEDQRIDEKTPKSFIH